MRPHPRDNSRQNQMRRQSVPKIVFRKDVKMMKIWLQGFHQSSADPSLKTKMKNCVALSASLLMTASPAHKLTQSYIERRQV